MIGSITLENAQGEDVTLHNDQGGQRGIEEAEGLVGGVSSRRRVTPRAGYHGSTDESRFAEAAQYTFKGWVEGTGADADAAIQDAFDEWYTIGRTFNEAVGTERLLKWTLGDTGIDLQAEVKLVSVQGPILREAAAILDYQVTLESEDFRSYSQDLLTVIGPQLGGADGGKVYSYTYPRAYALGAGTRVNLCTNPRGAVDKTGWTNTGGTVTREASMPTTGGLPSSLPDGGFKCVASGGSTFATIEADVTSGQTYTFSAYVRNDTSGQAVDLRVRDAGGTGKGDSTDTSEVAGDFERLSVTFTADSTGTWKFDVRWAAGGTPPTFWWTGALIEQSLSADAYFDGAGYVDSDDVWTESEGVLTGWFGTAHDSTSYKTSELIVDNEGNVETPGTLLVYGRIVDPEIVHLGTGESINYSGTVADGDYLELDLAERTAKTNGTTRVDHNIDFANTRWYELPAGETQLALRSDDYDADAHLEVKYRHAYK